MDVQLKMLPHLIERVFASKMVQDHRFNPQCPSPIIEIGGGARKVYYHSAAINGSTCSCLQTFGGEKAKERHLPLLLAASTGFCAGVLCNQRKVVQFDAFGVAAL